MKYQILFTYLIMISASDTKYKNFFKIIYFFHFIISIKKIFLSINQITKSIILFSVI